MGFKIKRKKANILVTGSHRSGSTWVGSVIRRSKQVYHVHEPFNISTHKESPFPFKYWFEYVSGESSEDYQRRVIKYIRSYSQFKFQDIFVRIFRIKSRKTLKKYLLRITGISHRRRKLYKDPIALMSAEWLSQELPAQVVVLIRHPAAFVASIKVKDWKFDFTHFLNQEHLMKRYLPNFEIDLQEYSQNEKDIIDQGILMWNIFHSVIIRYMNEYEDQWYFVRHEDLSLDPKHEYEKMFEYLNLRMTRKVQKYIIKSTTSKKKSLLKRDSKKNIKSWKQRLTEDEINRIKDGTKLISSMFYSAVDW
ncbi:sulfotransferase [Maribellus mangrovi]|uniref:sulfotransferase n=1 Tax=Maribellus mangrovi TaxID=3133146 RepID=UPI0030ECC488